MSNLNSNGLYNSTYFSNPEAKYIIETGDDRYGYGIFGYYISQFEVTYNHRKLEKEGCKNLSISPYNPNEEFRPGINPLVKAHWQGYI